MEILWFVLFVLSYIFYGIFYNKLRFYRLITKEKMAFLTFVTVDVMNIIDMKAKRCLVFYDNYRDQIKSGFDIVNSVLNKESFAECLLRFRAFIAYTENFLQAIKLDGQDKEKIRIEHFGNFENFSFLLANILEGVKNNIEEKRPINHYTYRAVLLFYWYYGQLLQKLKKEDF